MLYTSTSMALAVLEIVVHLPSAPIPFNRYIVRIEVPDREWAKRECLNHVTAPGGWDAEPAGLTSRECGNAWIRQNQTLLLVVPSVVVPLEHNVLINPRHADARRITITTVQRFIFDGRLRNISNQTLS